MCPSHKCDNSQHTRRVCATNGVTYDNLCHFMAENCRERGTLQIDYMGRCRREQQFKRCTLGIIHQFYIISFNASDSCDRVHCLAGKNCVMDSNYGQPHCVACLPINTCPDEIQSGGPICGADGVTYNNMCQFARATCLRGESIGIAYMGRPCDRKFVTRKYPKI